MKTEHTFDGLPCPKIFKERLERLRKLGILDDPKFIEAFRQSAEKVRAETQAEWDKMKSSQS